MAQVSWRAEDALVDRVRKVAAAHKRSMNDYITMVLEAATNPDLAQDEYTRIMERLARAGLAVPELDVRMGGGPRERPPAEEVERARRAAGKGTPLSDLVSEGRGE
jgi:hypothetical protein